MGASMRASALLAFSAVLAVAAFAIDESVEESVITIDEVSPKLELMEVGEGDGTTLGMSASQRAEFKEQYMNLAAAIHTPKLRSDVMIAERMASDALDSE